MKLIRTFFKKINSLLLNYKYIKLFITLIIIYYLYLISNWFFFHDDIHYLCKLIHEPFLELLTPQPYFHYRPLSQYIYFGICYKLFGLDPPGYYIINLSFLLLNIWIVYKILISLGVEKKYSIIICFMTLTSLAFYRSLIWLSNMQHILYILFVLLAIRCEILYMNTKKNQYKIISIILFILGLFSNVGALVFIPLAGILYLFFDQSKRDIINVKYLIKLSLNIIPYVIIFVIFFYFYSETSSFKLQQSLLYNKNTAYYSEFTPLQALTNLNIFIAYLFPFKKIFLYIIICFFLISLIKLIYYAVQKQEPDTLTKMNIFFALWFIISIAMFLFFIRWNPPNFVFLGSIGIYYIFIINIIIVLERLIIKDNKKWMAHLIVFIILSIQIVYSFINFKKEHPLGYGGIKVKEGIKQIQYLFDNNIKEKKKIYFINYERYITKEKNKNYIDLTRFFFWDGKIFNIFFHDRELLFFSLKGDIDEFKKRLLKDEGIIYYKNTVNFFL